jgi:hypothetical protein
MAANGFAEFWPDVKSTFSTRVIGLPNGDLTINEVREFTKNTRSKLLVL